MRASIPLPLACKASALPSELKLGNNSLFEGGRRGRREGERKRRKKGGKGEKRGRKRGEERKGETPKSPSIV